MANSGNHHRFRKALGITLLALICIGGMELAVCRFAAPELFARVTAPVTALVQRAASGGAGLRNLWPGLCTAKRKSFWWTRRSASLRSRTFRLLKIPQ